MLDEDALVLVYLMVDIIDLISTCVLVYLWLHDPMPTLPECHMEFRLNRIMEHLVFLVSLMIPVFYILGYFFDNDRALEVLFGSLCIPIYVFNLIRTWAAVRLSRRIAWYSIHANVVFFAQSMIILALYARRPDPTDPTNPEPPQPRPTDPYTITELQALEDMLVRLRIYMVETLEAVEALIATFMQLRMVEAETGGDAE
ncbi:Uu.00g036580.m01.CDS01 [Anthostomella pinea]|uniref:Uu.00g036580.m01.CDS01 n=1 Tax=Anthostomella pinea TaxID=933095 RepID=A0AAI8YDJ4_9PEZI|nr:Uu.00g036580.m01.CDS01 [Anthostomella pinea]